jgi:uncharacterized membrane protein YfcA
VAPALKIPAMDTASRLPIEVSSATSNFMIGVTAAASGVANFARGDIDPRIAGNGAVRPGTERVRPGTEKSASWAHDLWPRSI